MQFEGAFVDLAADLLGLDLGNAVTPGDTAKPRLKVVGASDYAINEHLPFLRFIRDAWFAISALLLIGLAYLAQQSRHTDKQLP